jgi:P27 family predicted phage terminase small subunit
MRGRKPAPTSLRILHGSVKAKREKRSEPQAPAGIPICPDWLEDEAKREWARIIPDLEEMNLLSSADRAALAAYCQAFADFCFATKAVKKSGRTFKTKTGYVAINPLVSEKRSAMRTMKDFLSEFGLTPSSRSRLSVPQKEVDDGMDAFLKGAG